MQYLKVEELTRSYGTLVFFDKIGFVINRGDKIAIVAKNGAGKTTLLKTLYGIEPPENGKIELSKDISVAYLPQEPDFDPEETVIDSVFNSENTEVKIIKEYENAIVAGDTERMDKLIPEMDRLNLWDYETRIRQILSVFKINEVDKKTGMLSGGQKKRLALVNTLINEPDFIILDEPTNHLDLEMIEWLENYLTRSNATLLMVTHDRYFLDRVCNMIFELENQTLFTYKGNYSYYLQKRQERIDQAKAETDKAKNLMRNELDWMRRMPKARGTKAKYRVDRFYDLKDKASKNYNEDKLDIDIEAGRLGKKIVEFENVSKSFGQIKILNDFSYKFKRFEKLGIIGKNGTGKSTFLNILTEVIKPDQGRIIHGETVKTAYYKQTGIITDENKKLIEVISEISDKIPAGEGKFMSASAFLRKWGFNDPMHYVEVHRLSGGEKRRLYLMSVLMDNPNFLILDEPTNDLDIMTLNILEDYLKSFNGCVIIVSHDRFFMDKVVDHLFVFRGDAKVEDFAGNYSEFRDYEKQNEKDVRREEKKEKKENKLENKNKKEKTKLSFNEKREFEQLENEIEQLESEKENLEAELSSGKLKPDELTEKSQTIGQLIETIDKKTERWMELSDLD
jgi:ATP-binding cassette subfamily F protein uup